MLIVGTVHCVVFTCIILKMFAGCAFINHAFTINTSARSPTTNLRAIYIIRTTMVDTVCFRAMTRGINTFTLFELVAILAYGGGRIGLAKH